jgi:hypothetical protein
MRPTRMANSMLVQDSPPAPCSHETVLSIFKPCQSGPVTHPCAEQVSPPPRFRPRPYFEWSPPLSSPRGIKLFSPSSHVSLPGLPLFRLHLPNSTLIQQPPMTISQHTHQPVPNLPNPGAVQALHQYIQPPAQWWVAL